MFSVIIVSSLWLWCHKYFTGSWGAFKTRSSIYHEIFCERKSGSNRPEVFLGKGKAKVQQIYWRTLMLKCDFNKFPKQLYWNHTSQWVFSCKVLFITSEVLLLKKLKFLRLGSECISGFENTSLKITNARIKIKTFFQSSILPKTSSWKNSYILYLQDEFVWRFF